MKEKLWRAETEEIDMTIYTGDLWIVKYEFEGMSGIWDLSTHFIGSMSHLTMSISEHHTKNQEQEYGIPETIMQVLGRIESGNLVIEFDDNTLLPQEVKELTFITEDDGEDYVEMKDKMETGEEKYNEESGNIGYAFITDDSLWKTLERNDGSYMELKENNGKIIITYNFDGSEGRAELIFAEDTEPNELASFNLKISTDKEFEGIEELPHIYEYNNEGKISAVIMEDFGVAFIYKSKMFLTFCENELFPQYFMKVVLEKQ